LILIETGVGLVLQFMWSDMPVTRSQRGELRDECDQFVGQGTDDERLSEHEASEIGLEETLHSVKGVLGEIKDEESKLKGIWQYIFLLFHCKELLKLYVNLLYRFCVTILFLEIF
jgi:hypothetical protein